MLLAAQRVNRERSATLAHQPSLLPLPVLLLLILTLVGRLAPLAESDLDLRASPAVEVDRHRHQGHALTGDGAMQLGDLALVEQQLARPFRLMVEAVAVAEFGNIGVD